MKQEVVQDFLNLPGIAGVALADRLTPAYFYGFAASFDPLQQETVAQNIQQVLETTPEGFNAFEFEFDAYRVYLHKLNQGMTLLVLTGSYLTRSDYRQAVRRLLLELQLNEDDPIAAFRSLTASMSPVASGGSPAIEPQPAPPMPQSAGGAAVDLHRHSLPGAGLSGAAQSKVFVSLKEILAAMNALSRFTTRYLGTLVVANYWQATRPAVDWLNYFQIERSAQISLIVPAPAEQLPMTTEQHQYLRMWVAAFLERCSTVIRNFGKIVRQTLNEQQSALLFDLP